MSEKIDALARAHTEELIEAALQIMRDGEKDSDRMAAIKFLAETGHGKPNQAIIALPMTKRMAEQLYGLSKDELLEIIEPARGSASRAPVTIDYQPADPSRSPDPHPPVGVSPERDPLLD